MRPTLRLFLAAAALPFLGAAAGPPSGPVFHEPNAVVAGLTQADLNRIAVEAFRAGGGPSFEGRRERMSRGLSDVRWSANLSEPVIEIDDGGRVHLALDILSADLHVGRFERKLLRRMTSCDDLGVAVDAGQPVALSATLRVAVEGGSLRLIPETVDLQDTAAFRLIKPSRCRNAPLPHWLLWQLGKPKLRQRLEGLDDLILARLKDGAAQFDNGSDLQDKRWTIRPLDPNAGPIDFGLYSQSARTDGHSLLVALEASSSAPDGAPAAIPAWTGDFAGRSFLALSQPFVSALIQADYLDFRSTPKPPTKNLKLLLGSDSIRAVIPGLARVRRAEDLRIGLRTLHQPTIEFATAPRSAALIRVNLSGIDIDLYEAAGEALEILGTLSIDSARVTLRPYLGPLGGVSFEIVQNNWHVTARGIETDEGTLAAVLQEMVFGQVFGTRVDPLARGALRLGPAQLVPTRFEVRGEHLIVDLEVAGAEQAQTQRAAAARGDAGQTLAVSQAKR